MRPVYDMLTAMGARRRFHMPGHKGQAPFGAVDLYALDTTELPVTDDLYSPERGLLAAQKMYAQAVGAAQTILLHNGSTAGIHAMVQLYAREGDTVLLPRNAHLSAVNGCVLGGVQAEWIPVTQRTDGYCYIAEQDVLAAIDAHPGAKAVLLTRPDYYGGCIPLRRIIEHAHSLGMRVVVDEAHGAHLPWMAGWSALEMGADAVTQSIHKTLPGLTGAAALHLRHAEDAARVMRILRREQTSSPSFILMLSIDDSRALMQQEGRERLAAVSTAANELRAMLPALGYSDAHAVWQETGMAFDPTRLVIEAPQGGEALAQSLRARGVDVEMNDGRHVVLILSVMDEPADILALAEALREIPAMPAEIPELPNMTMVPPRAMQLRPAAMAEDEQVPLGCAVGRIAAQSAGLYPPGVPLVAPGEYITEETVMLLAGAGVQNRFGMEGDTLRCVKQ